MINRFAAFAAVLALSCPAWATLTTTTNSASYTGNGSTLAFTVPFKFLANSDLVVTVAGVTKALGSDYSVRGAGAATGTVTMTSAPVSGAAVVITRAVPLTQTTSLRQSRSFDPATIENIADKQMMATQQLANTAASATTSGLLSASDWVRFNNVVLQPLNQFQAVGTGAVARPIGDKLSAVISPKDFGAVGDGVADDTLALQRAITATPNGGVLAGDPNATYLISGTGLVINAKTGSRFLGNGAAIKLSAASTQVAGGFGATSIIISSSTGVVFNGWVLNGNAKDSNQLGLSVCTECEVSDLRVTAGGHIAQVVSSGGVRNRYLRNVIFSGIGTARGLWVGNVNATDFETDPLIHGNQAYSNGFTGIVVGGSNGGRVSNNLAFSNAGSGIIVSGGLGFPTHDVSIVGNTANGNTLSGIQCDALTSGAADSPYNILVSGNVTNGNANSGIYAVNATNWTITGNVARDNVVGGITCDRLNRGTISGNITYDSRSGASRTQTHGIRCIAQTGANDVVDVAITGNTSFNNLTDGIRLQTSGTGTIVGATVTGNLSTSNGGVGIQTVESAVAGTITRSVVMGNVSRGNTTSDMRIDQLDVVYPPSSNAFTTFSGTKADVWTFADGDTTPSVAGRSLFKANNTSATSITNFTNGTPGQNIRVWFNNANTTIVQGGGMALGSATSVTPPADSYMDFVFDGVWREAARSVKLGAGNLTLAAGTGTATVFGGARCVCTDTSAANACRTSVTGTTLTITGTGTDVITYDCH